MKLILFARQKNVLKDLKDFKDFKGPDPELQRRIPMPKRAKS